MKNSADQGWCYPQRPKAEVDNTLRDLQNSSYPTEAEFNNCLIIYSKYFQTLLAENELFIFLLTKNNTPCGMKISADICPWTLSAPRSSQKLFTSRNR